MAEVRDQPGENTLKLLDEDVLVRLELGCISAWRISHVIVDNLSELNNILNTLAIYAISKTEIQVILENELVSRNILVVLIVDEIYPQIQDRSEVVYSSLLNGNEVLGPALVLVCRLVELLGGAVIACGVVLHSGVE